jgi:phosphate starvation-inducible PhoH-like protein
MGRGSGNSKKGIKRFDSNYEFNDKDFDTVATPFFFNTDSIPEINFHPKNLKQQELYENLHNKTVNFVIGEVGTGKTTIPIIYALQMLKQRKYKKVMLFRPASLDEDENLGFLKGDMQEKIAPLILPLKSAIEKFTSRQIFESLTKANYIEGYSLGHVRGMEYSNSIVILDEFQNTKPKLLRMLLTRINDSSKVIIIGDGNQIDLADKLSSAFHDIERFRNKGRIGFTVFDKRDIVRGEITKVIESCYPDEDSEISILYKEWLNESN